MKEYYQKQIIKLKADVEHIKRHIDQATDETEVQRLKRLKSRLVDEIMNYQGAVDLYG